MNMIIPNNQSIEDMAMEMTLPDTFADRDAEANKGGHNEDRSEGDIDGDDNVNPSSYCSRRIKLLGILLTITFIVVLLSVGNSVTVAKRNVVASNTENVILASPSKSSKSPSPKSSKSPSPKSSKSPVPV